MSDGFALISTDYIMKYLLRAYDGDEYAKEKIHIAATLGGMAINDAGTTVIHAVGYYLTTHHNVHHGLANALVMPYILEYNLKYVSDEKVGTLLRILGVSSIQELVKIICRLMDSLGIPDSIADIGFKSNELDHIARETVGYKRNIANNPAPVDEAVIKELVSKALLGRSKVYGS